MNENEEGSGGIAPRFLNLGTSWRWMVALPSEKEPTVPIG